MKNFLPKLTAFIAILGTLQIIVSALFPPQLPAEILALDQQLDTGVDIMYLGDSTLIYPQGEPTTPEILRDLIDNQTIGAVAHPAYNLDLYERYVDYIVEQDSPPDIVIIPINMRSFSPEWDLRPNYQFEQEKAVLTLGPLLSSIVYQPFNVFGLFDSAISQDEFLSATVFNGEQPVGDVAQFESLIAPDPETGQVTSKDFAYRTVLPSDEDEAALQATFIYYYMDALTPDHRKIQSMLDTARLLKKNRIEPIFYITPINYELGERHLGPEFREQVVANTAVVEETLGKKNIDVLNLVFDLEAYNFVDTEHLTENGKSYVAEALAAVIEPPRPERLATTAVDDAPTPRTATLYQAGRPLDTSTPTPTASPTPAGNDAAAPTTSTPEANSLALPQASPTAPPTPRNTPVVIPSPTPQPPTALGAGKLLSANTEPWGTFEPVGNYALDVYRIRYQTLGQDEAVVEVEADIYVPRVADTEQFPLLLYAPGTTGLADRCAPLNELRSGDNWGGYHSYMLEYSAQGFIGILPNYQGFADDGLPHPYFVAQLQGRALLDAGRAAFTFFEQAGNNLAAQPHETLFMAGYSSGGHAAFAARDLAADYAPELPFAGVIGHAPTTNIETLLKENPVFSPYIVQAYRDIFGADIIEPAAVFQPRWIERFESDVMSRCVDGLFSYYGFSARQMYTDQFNEALTAGQLRAVAPQFQAALTENNAGLSSDGANIPVLLLQGTADQVVTPPSQQAFAANLCRLNSRVTYISYPAEDHPGIRRASFRDTITWMQDVAAGARSPSDCADLTRP